jgi:signal transduction histidine kinase/CheY-like chemotaxis protein
MEGEPLLGATVWSPDNEMTADEFLKHLQRSSIQCNSILFRVKGGATSRFNTFICPFQKDGNRFQVFQLLPEPGGASDRAAIPAATELADAAESGTAQKQRLDCALQLIRTVALDFNNALTTILGHTSLILGRVEPSHPWRNSLVEVEKSAEKAAEIAQDLADFSRQEKDVHTQTPGNLNSVIRHAVELFQGPNQGNILWTLQLEKRVFTVTFDEAKMQQAFVRILENAVEAVGPDGRITVRTLNQTFAEPVVSSSIRLAAGHYVSVEISDNGCGIPVAALPRVFEPFFTTKKDPRHRGLGLAWVYGIVTNHGGVVDVSSRGEGGTSVRLFLPAQQKIVRDQPTKVENLRGHETVLFVDDEEMLLNLGQVVLSAFGYKVVTANSGAAALDLFRNGPDQFQIVITDLVMPGMSGRELVDQLRRLSASVPILCTSGYVRSPGEGDEDTYLKKPFTSQELLWKVRQMLGRHEIA